MRIDTDAIIKAMELNLDYQIFEVDYPHEYYHEVVGELMVLQIYDNDHFLYYKASYLSKLQEELEEDGDMTIEDAREDILQYVDYLW